MNQSLEMQLLKGQYEREKKLLDEKVRQLAEFETASKNEQALVKENSALRKVNKELTQAIKDERAAHAKINGGLTAQLQSLQMNLQRIEEGCARELVLRIKNLRDEILATSNARSQLRVGSYAEDTVENRVKQISHRVQQLIR